MQMGVTASSEADRSHQKGADCATARSCKPAANCMNMGLPECQMILDVESGIAGNGMHPNTKLTV